MASPLSLGVARRPPPLATSSTAPSNSKTRACLLFFILSAHFACTHSHSAGEINSPPPAHKTSTAEGRAAMAEDEFATGGDQHANTLADEIDHEEFIASGSDQPHSRRKRLIWITDDGRLALPPGTSLTFTPTIALPLVRHPPEGFFSNMSISFPVTIDFDKLGLTDNQNPLGDLPPIFARSFGHTAGRMLGNYVARYLHVKAKRDLAAQQESEAPTTPMRRRRDSPFQVRQEKVQHDANEEEDRFPTLPEGLQHVFHGGERVLLYGVLEDFLGTFGMNGKACLLRFICEIHSRSLEQFGVFGEMIKLFLTVTKSPFADLLPEYVRAQAIGEGRQAPAECFPYYKQCPKSIFKAAQMHNYGEPQKGEYHEVDDVDVLQPHTSQQQDQDDELSTNEITPRKYLLPMRK